MHAELKSLMSNTYRRPTATNDQGYLDLGCGSLAHIRVTSLAKVGVYHHSIKQSAWPQSNVSSAYGINFTVTGKWECRYGAKSYALTPGFVTVAAPGEEYWCRHFAAEPNTSYLVQLVPDAIDDDAPPLFKTRAMLIEELGGFIVRAAACSSDEEFESRIFDIFDFVSRCSYNGEGRRNVSPLRVQRMKRFIEQHCSERLTLADLAGSVGINPYTCLRQFKAVSGETPISYIVRCRIDRAKMLLKGKDLSIDDVAKRAGFASHSYFCRMFKRLTGMSPGHFRQLDHRA